MKNEIGSSFWLKPGAIDNLSGKSPNCLNLLSVGESYVSTCRSAIGMILDDIQPEQKVALVPAFTCESVLIPFLQRGYQVEPYPVDKGLNVNVVDFKKKVESVNPSVILIHPYFGFDTTSELRTYILELRKQRIIVIEDMTQNMFSKFEPLSVNYYVGSIRKWLPLPDGAFVSMPLGEEVVKEDVELVQAKVNAMTEKGNWMINGIGDKESFRQKNKKAEELLSSRNETFLMSSISKQIFAATDIGKMRDLRWENYYYLEFKLCGEKILSDYIIPIMPPISSNICPFLFPVLVPENRYELQHYLASNGIYATVIWSIPETFKDKIDDSSRYIFDHILCFYVDQRYTIDDMKRTVEVLTQYYS